MLSCGSLPAVNRHRLLANNHPWRTGVHRYNKEHMRLTTTTATNPHDCRWAPMFMFAAFLEEQRWARSKYSELSTHLLPLALWYGLRPFPFGGIPPFNHTHLPSPPPDSISAALLPLWSAYVLLKGWNTSNREEAASRAWLSYEQLSFFIFLFFLPSHRFDNLINTLK